jgi:hypothetical protein
MSDKVKEKGRKFDGRSRYPNDLYRKRWNEIFNKDQQEEDKQKQLEEIADRNGF